MTAATVPLLPDRYLPGEWTPPADRTATVIRHLGDGRTVAWLPQPLTDEAWMPAERLRWMHYLDAHGIDPAHVVSWPAIIRDEVARTLSVAVFGPRENPGARMVDGEVGVYVKHRRVIRLEAPPQPFPSGRVWPS